MLRTVCLDFEKIIENCGKFVLNNLFKMLDNVRCFKVKYRCQLL